MINKKILLTGGSGLIAGAAARALAADNEVWCLARFTEPQTKLELEEHGIKTFVWDLENPVFDGLPSDFTHAVHAAVRRGTEDDYDRTIEVNCTALGMLMTHCQNAEAFLAMSSFAVYTRQAPDHRYAESDPTSGSRAPVYGTMKIAYEGTARAYARTLGLPTTIARMNYAYGPHAWGGAPMLYLQAMQEGRPVAVAPQGQSYWNPIHIDDIARQVPLLLDVASSPARVVNFAGDETIEDRELVSLIGELAGLEPKLEEHPADLLHGYASDNARRLALIGACQVSLREGLAGTIEAFRAGAVEGLSGPALSGASDHPTMTGRAAK